ncbi:MAG: signal transduction histidine kinase [Verrucomicrobiaceae bacterium]|nr:signal transduction histidine kinase [Verrucomicrobiaceae bacterium]
MTSIPPRHSRSLAFWLAMSVAVFVLVCSLALLVVFGQRVAREESLEFEALARANALFLDRTPLPHSDRMAAQLGEVMGAQVVFSDAGIFISRPGVKVEEDLRQVPVDGVSHRLGDRRIVVGHQLRRGPKVFFVRQAGEGSPGLAMLDRGDSWTVLGIVWLLSCALAWWLARRVAKPLRALATAVHDMGGDGPLPPLPVDRTDEIGLLARALTDTHASLIEERGRRRSAERLALLGRMATGLAHEVRNPVAAIRMHAQLLEGAPADEAATSVKLIESEAARIELLVSQWMRYARPAPPVMTEVVVNDMILQAIQTLEPQARHAGVAMPFLPHSGSVTSIQGDRSRLQQVLLNVLLNAIQSMPAGGVTTIASAHKDGKVTVVVEDEGTGFSDQALAKLGEPFFSEKEGGMGLGLAVAQELCRAHGGDLHAANRPERGARVAIELPAFLPKGGPSSVPFASH